MVHIVDNLRPQWVGVKGGEEMVSGLLDDLVGDTTSELVSRLMSEPMSEPTSGPVSESTSEPVSESTSEPVGEPTSELVNGLTSDLARVVHCDKVMEVRGGYFLPLPPASHRLDPVLVGPFRDPILAGILMNRAEAPRGLGGSDLQVAGSAGPQDLS